MQYFTKNSKRDNDLEAISVSKQGYFASIKNNDAPVCTDNDKVGIPKGDQLNQCLQRTKDSTERERAWGS
ncbi:hypothetical protein A0256_16580 [Mucilaginibacter sp. PAMC 26640]|nr:hypothetical protein A0256_16580 [Mucilaginibacter sp. PAMC 26640]